LKKATQLALIWVAALDDPPPEEAPPAGEADERADEGAAELAAALAGLLALADGLEPDDEPPLLPQAATVTASAASAAMENTLTGGNRIGALPVAHAPNSRTVTQVGDVDYAEQRPSILNINACVAKSCVIGHRRLTRPSAWVTAGAAVARPSG
jgi:hypothetical protein